MESNPSTPRRTGAELIAAERDRQIRQEGWTAEHDAAHRRFELSHAALAYLVVSITGGGRLPPEDRPPCWPWDDKSWRPSQDTVRNLAKAGALIAAEIDREQAGLGGAA